jgi:arylsulfatase A-like enzyme
MRLFALLPGLIAFGAQAADPRPNLLVFLADDLGQRDLGVYGSTFYETPRLDRLAAEGARFTDAYASCPVCSPTRASLQTGLIPNRTGVTDYIGAAHQSTDWKRNTRLRPAPFTPKLEPKFPTLAETLKGAGYATFFAGKWHLGPEGNWPDQRGYDHNLGGVDRGGPYGGKQYFSPYGNPRLKDGPPGEHLPDRLARETAAFIRSRADRPFFALFSLYSVHTPLQARPDLQKKYEEKRARLGRKTEWGREPPRDVRLTQDHAVYAAMVEAMDQAVGTVLDAVAEAGLDRRTLVLFTSDNGGLSTSEGWPTSNQPLRGGKGWLYEGGLRVPLLARWTGVIPAGQVPTDPVYTPDLHATLLAAAGVAAPAHLPADGLSLLPRLRDGVALPGRTLFWHYPHYGNQGGMPGTVVRRGPLKLIRWFEGDRQELFDVVADPGETRDLAAERPQEVAALRADLDRLHREIGCRDPMPNPQFDAAKPDGRFAPRR